MLSRAEVDTTRLVLLTDSFPDLREYARKVAKVRRAIEDVKQAYATVVVDLEQRIARQTHDTQDPLESLLYLVRMMKDSLHLCVLESLPVAPLVLSVRSRRILTHLRGPRTQLLRPLLPQRRPDPHGPAVAHRPHPRLGPAAPL